MVPAIGHHILKPNKGNNGDDTPQFCDMRVLCSAQSRTCAKFYAVKRESFLLILSGEATFTTVAFDYSCQDFFLFLFQLQFKCCISKSPVLRKLQRNLVVALNACRDDFKGKIKASCLGTGDEIVFWFLVILHHLFGRPLFTRSK